MRCQQCGADVPAQATFCPQCGVQLNRKASSSGLQAGGAQGSARDAAEQDLWTGSYSPRAMVGPFVGAALLTIIGMIVASIAGPMGWTVVIIAALVLFAYLGCLLFYRRMTVCYRLTTQRLLREIGILSKTDDRILVIEIDDVTVQQGIFDRMFNLGTIVLNTKDETSGVLSMQGIENPRHVADLIDEARRSERGRRGLYTINA